MKQEKDRGLRLELDRLAKNYGSGGRGVTAVDGIDLAIEPGEFFILLGPSGCGKSTLLEMLAGLEPPTSGEIRFDGEAVAAPARGVFLTPKERNVAMVFQSYALYPHLTVSENIAFPLRVGGAKTDSIGAAVREAAESVEIGELLERRPAELSGGQRQRVAIARAIVRRPSLFLMDEPLSNLDARLRASTRAKLKALQRRLGVTTVYVTHDQQEAMALGDRVAILNRGRIEQIGTPASLYADPATAFVARFVGNPPMNLIRTRRSGEADGPLLQAVGTEWIFLADVTQGRELPAGESILIGIRPEDVRILPSDSRNGLEARVDSVEPLGRENLLHLSAGALTFTALSPHSGPGVGETVRAEFDPGRLHYFPDDREEM